MKKYLFLLLFFLLPKVILGLETLANQAILYDLETNSVIFEKNADKLMSPSSMSKLMTVYYVFNKLKNNEISLDDKFRVSKKAWKKGGSKMFLNVDSYVTIKDLLMGIIVQSGNDACITIAEGFEGSEDNFARELNLLAKEIGLENSNFTNATGWPDLEHLMTARDVLKLAIRTIIDFPEYYKFYSEKFFKYNNIKQTNRNPLLFSDSHSDGLKTGHTSLGGYGLVASSIKNGRRLFLVLNGLESSKLRRDESKRIMNVGFFEFKNYQIAKKRETVENIKVWNGKEKTIGIYSKNDIGLTIPKSHRDKIKFFVQYFSPLSAPIKKDDKIAKLIVKKDQEIFKEFPLYAAKSVEKINIISRIIFKFKYLIFGETIYSS